MQIDQLPVNKMPEAEAYLAKNKNRDVSLLFDRDDFQFFVTMKQ